MHDSYLVIGGCGFLGKHVVDALLNRGEPDVAVFDLKTRDPDPRAHYFAGDLTNLQQLEHAIQEVLYTLPLPRLSFLSSQNSATLLA